MKKAFSILLLVIFLFNVGGYYIVLWGLRHQVNDNLSDRLDQGLYSREETVELKIPVSLPYPLQARGFERIDGKFEYKGEYFKLVKHKLEHDTLYIVCIKNIEEKRLVDTMTEYANLANDLPGTAKKAMTFLSKLVKDYTPEKSFNLGERLACRQYFTFAISTSDVLTRPSSIPSPPPRA